jgi:hypothetical protein
MIVAKLNVTKFDKTKFFNGEKGVYADIVLIDSPDDYGNDGFVAQSVSKEEREAGIKGAVIGSFRKIDRKTKPAEKRPAPPARQPAPEDDDIPF